MIALYPFKILLSPLALMGRILRFVFGALETAAGFLVLPVLKDIK